MTLRFKAILAAFLGLLASLLWWRRRAAIERDARVQAEIDRDVAAGRAATAEATVIVAAQVEADKDAGHADAAQVEAAAQAAPEHPERAAARERQRLSDETAALLAPYARIITRSLVGKPATKAKCAARTVLYAIKSGKLKALAFNGRGKNVFAYAVQSDEADRWIKARKEGKK